MNDKYDVENEISSNIESRQYRKDSLESKIRIIVFVIFAITGVGLIFSGFLLVYQGKIDATNALLFIVPGIFSLAFGSSVALGKDATEPIERLMRNRSRYKD